VSKRKEEGRGAYWIEGPLPETPQPDRELRAWTETTLVGQRQPRVDAYERVSGSAVYTYDVWLPGMLYAAILRCPHAHARVVSVNTAAAERMPGVHAVLTGSSPGADIPWYGRENPQSMLLDPHCRYAGEEVAAVAAETPYQAWDAARAIEVEYEELPFVVDAEDALRPEAPPVHEGGNRDGDPYRYSRGDVEAGFAEADVVLEETFTVGTHIHVPMESFGSVAKWDGDKLTVWDSTQGVYAVAFDLARAFRLPMNRVRVIGHYIGGGFGSKLDTGKYTVMAALLARATARPVKLFLTREETYLSEGNRPGASMTIKAGVKRDGTLTALRLDNIGSGGAYSYQNRVGFQVGELYLCPNVEVEEHFAYTNIGRARAMRAPGCPQGSFALEQMIDALAEAIDIDPVELRLRNIPDFSQITEDRQPYTSTGLRQCLEEGAGAFGWRQVRDAGSGDGHIQRGVGVAAGVWAWGSGGPPSTATVKLFVDGSVLIRTGASDLGTGTKTIASMIVSEELGVSLDRIRIENADTANTPFHYSSGGSQTLPGMGPTVRLAAADCKRQLLEMAAEDLETAVEDLEVRDNAVVSRSDPERRMPIAQIIQGHRRLDIVGVGYRGPNPEGKVIQPFGAQFAEVEVNTRTGEVRLLRLLGAHESGKVINRLTYDNQVFGGMTQGVGFGMTEHRVVDRQTGRVVSANGHDYKIPTALDVPPDHQVVAIDPGDTECNNIGAKGLGEPPVIPTGAAIANAIYNAIGIRPTEAPINTQKINQLLAERDRG